MTAFPYDTDGWDPAAAVIRVRISSARDEAQIELPALLDTGSDSCVLPRQVAEQLDLKRMRYSESIGWEDGVQTSRLVEVFWAWVQTPGSLPNGTAEVLCHDFLPGESFMIIGRNLLNLWRITLDGPNLQFEIST